MYPKISVLMSCYNAKRWIKESIESILVQTYKDFEFIIVDDGSKDDTLGIIQSYAQAEPRIRIITKSNTGLADSLNVGISAAHGEWIARIDADDLSFPERLQKQVNFVKKNPEIVLIGSGCVEINDQGKALKRHNYPMGHRALVGNLLYLKRFFPHSSVFMKKDIIKQLGGYNIFYNRSQDKDLWLRLSEVGRIACFPKILIKLRKHEGSISYDPKKSMEIAATVCYFLRKNGIQDPSLCEEKEWKKFKAWLNNRLIKEKVFERKEFWQSLRNEWYKEKNKSMLQKGAKLFVKLVRSGHGAKIIKEKMFGKNLGKKLAKEWNRE